MHGAIGAHYNVHIQDESKRVSGVPSKVTSDCEVP